MRSQYPKSIRICLIIYFVLLTVFFFRIIVFTDLSDFILAGKTNPDYDYTAGWTLDNGESVDLNDFSARKYGGSFTVSKVLPDVMEETDSVYFSTSNLKFKVYVDGELIYSFDTRENLTGTGDGISYHMIGLGSKDQGHTMTIDGETVFKDRHGGRINEMQYGPEEVYRYHAMRQNLLGVGLSILMIIFGVVIIGFYFGMFRKSSVMRSLWALGLSAVIFGIWSLVDTGIPQLLTGCTYAARELSYGILHFAGFPMIWFVTRITRNKKILYLYLSFLTFAVCFGWLLISRYLYGRDMHTMVGVVYFSYASMLVILMIMLIDNEIYCRKKDISSGLTNFYLGAGIFVMCSFVDMIRYQLFKKSSIGHGSWFRFGLVIFFVYMAFQIFEWWSSEKTSLERDRFINRLLQYVTDADDPDIRINKVLEYLCKELHADRAYIFEDMNNGTFDNTYEYCNEGVTPEIDNLKGLPFEGVIDSWYREYEKGGHILIYDIEKYRSESETMYQILKPQGINTLVTGPLVLEGKNIGFFGVDNPPVEMMEEISEIMKLLMFFLSQMISQRDSRKILIEYSYHDALTGTLNRRAIREFEKESLDTSRSYGFVMCDINGLKNVNDTEGHEAGDRMIKTVASSLKETFGNDNVYRMGGDEFAAYVYEDSSAGLEEKIDKVRSEVQKQGINVALGYAFADGGDPDYQSLRIKADNRMYDEKREFYKDDKDRRRSI